MASFSVSHLAVTKMIMHACKYPHAAVNGVLLAKRPILSSSPPGVSDPAVNPASSSAVVITDAIPLFHTNLNLAPMLEAALMQIESTRKESVIAGYYQANEMVSDTSHEGIGAQIYHKIADNCPLPKCLYVLLDNGRIDRDCEATPLMYFQRKEGGGGGGHKLESVPASSVVIDNEAECRERLAELLRGQVYRGLVDFDNHLDNIALDWSNSRLARQIVG